MEQQANKYYAIAYKLYTIQDGKRNLEEVASEEEPFIFISGFGTTIPGFAQNIEALGQGETFDFTLSKDEAYGDYYEERVIELAKEIFCIDGVFDAAHIHIDAIVPLQNEDGNRFMGRVLAISDDKVRIDLNHPLAGRDLNFVGKVVECREASNEEIQKLIKQLTGGCGGCGGGGCHGGCGGDCNCEGDGDCGGDCNCGNH